MIFIVFLISFIASSIGSICGLGGGIIIKPLLDLFQLFSISTINFLSGITVLSMALFSVAQSKMNNSTNVLKQGTTLAIGSAAGGFAGKYLFDYLFSVFHRKELIGAIQSASLVLITIGTLLYTLKKNKIKSKNHCNPILCSSIGLVLGIISAFLGIGGGPLNLIVLYYFFSMGTKEASLTSLYIILLSQLTSLFNSLFTKNIPPFTTPILIFMMIGGITGAILGRWIQSKINDFWINRLFIGLMIFMIIMNSYNFIGYIMR